jgi:hypothetical protein
MKLRTDGIYVQIGNEPWNTRYFNTTNCWYNIIKILDDDTALVIGLSGFSTFFDLDTNDEKKINNQKFMKEFFGIDDYDIINVVKN